MVKNVAITGANGFIGSRLRRRLIAHGFDVACLDIQGPWVLGYGMDNFEVDIADLDQVSKMAAKVKSADAVVHLAAVAAPRVAAKTPDSTFRVNVQGTYGALRFARAVEASRFIFASSAHVYGISPPYLPTDESCPTHVHDSYTATKVIGEALCDLFYRSAGISYCALRQFNGYGPGQSTDYFIPAMIEQAKKNGRIVLKGKNVTKDFVYVDDMVEAIMLSLTSDYVGPLNVGTGIQTSLEWVAAFIAKEFGVPLEFDETPELGPTQMQADVGRIKRTLGWVPTVSLTEGLRMTVEASREVVQQGA